MTIDAADVVRRLRAAGDDEAATLIEALVRERDEARGGWTEAEERLGAMIDATKEDWVSHGSVEIALGQWKARAEAAEAALAATSPLPAEQQRGVE